MRLAGRLECRIGEERLDVCIKRTLIFLPGEEVVGFFSMIFAAMEYVREVYQPPHDPARPVVCLDETTKQLLKETREPITMRKGRPRRVDYEYERNGTASIFMIFAPLE